MECREGRLGYGFTAVFAVKRAGGGRQGRKQKSPQAADFLGEAGEYQAM